MIKRLSLKTVCLLFIIFLCTNGVYAVTVTKKDSNILPKEKGHYFDQICEKKDGDFRKTVPKSINQYESLKIVDSSIKIYSKAQDGQLVKFDENNAGIQKDQLLKVK